MIRVLIFAVICAGLPFVLYPWQGARSMLLWINWVVPFLLAIASWFLVGRQQESCRRPLIQAPAWALALTGASLVGLNIGPLIGYITGLSVFTYGTAQMSPAFLKEAFLKIIPLTVIAACATEFALRCRLWRHLSARMPLWRILVITSLCGFLTVLPTPWLGFDPDNRPYVYTTLAMLILVEFTLGLLWMNTGRLAACIALRSLHFLVAMLIVTDSLSPYLSVMNFNSSSPRFYLICIVIATLPVLAMAWMASTQPTDQSPTTKASASKK